MVEKSKWKKLELFLPRTILNHKEYCITRGTAGIIANLKDLKDAGLVITSKSLFNSPIRPVQITDES